jgi:NAD(P)-dependent dehydrogenase (short-subunit alcohol dehydrogenase family)
MGRLNGKIAVVTGAGRGIGKETALFLANEGAKIVVNDLGGNTDGTGGTPVADEVVEEIKAAGGDAVANYDSVSEFTGGQNIFQTAIDAFGGMDILINNAGILRDKTLFNMEEIDWDQVIAVHLKGHFNCTKPFASYIRETNRMDCRIINMSSVSGLYGNFGQTNYGAAKAGIAGFTRSLSFEMAKYKCTVNTISPGAATRMTIDLIKAAGRDVDVNDWKQGPQQLAPVITWLCCDEASDVTNQIIHVQNGTVGIMQQPAVIESFLSDELWSLDQLDRVIGNLVETKKNHDSDIQKKAEPKKS